jgi:hypothetical protein
MSGDRTKKKQGETDHSTPAIVISPPTKRDRTVWSEQEECTLLQYLIDNKAERGEGSNFQAKTWHAVAKELQKSHPAAAVKDHKVCANKFKKVK